MQSNLLAEGRLGDGRVLRITQATDADAPAMAGVIVAAFSARPAVDPPPPALGETAASIARAIDTGFGLLATVEGVPAGVLLVGLTSPAARIRRVSVTPDFQRLGLASQLVELALEMLCARGIARVELIARAEFPQVVSWWQRRGFAEVGRDGTSLTLGRELPIRLVAPTAARTRQIGRRLAALVRPGDLILASGDLGAGKTTFAQGLGAGMKVSGPVISPTFVLSRVHPPTGSGPSLVHVDAYRLGSAAELADLDLEESAADSVTLVEWGVGIAEGLSGDHLLVEIRRSSDPADQTRRIFLTPVGERWRAVRSDLEAL